VADVSDYGLGLGIYMVDDMGRHLDGNEPSPSEEMMLQIKI
jgi:hypothetical protein